MRQPLFSLVTPLLLLAAGGCRDLVRSATMPPPPAAEFVIAAGDSSYWVTSDKHGIHWRGAPIDLARVSGRFVELYVVDDDESFQSADLIGQSVYRRDLRTGDSVLVYRDTLVPHLAREYARLHPDDHRLGAGDEPDDDPLWRATATLDLDATHDNFVSYTLHADVERENQPLWHTSRRGVLDIRTGRPASLADVLGAGAADVEHRRDAELRSAVDSVRTSRDERGTRASAILSAYRLDPTSFAITTVDGAPAIEYAVPGSGPGDAGHMLSLQPIRVAEPAWWRGFTASLPVSSAYGSRDVWRHASYEVVVRYDSTGDARLALRDSTSREWPVGRFSAPATRIYWLDRPTVDTDTRHALIKAFQAAAGYGEESRVAARQHGARLYYSSFKR
jgi:hypothetical protein